MPNLWTIVEANILLTIKFSGPTGACNLSSKKDGARNHGGIKSGTKKRLQVFALIVFPGVGRFRLLEGAYVVMVVVAPHLVEE